MTLQHVAAAHDVHGGLPLGPGLGEDQSAVVEIDGEEPNLAGHFRAAVLPAKASGNHQVDHEEQLALEFENDPLAKTMEVEDLCAAQGVQRRVDGAKQERTGEPDILHTPSHDSRA